MLRAGLATALLMGLGATATASDRVRVFVNYDSGGYYDTGRHYHDRACRDRRYWARRDGWYGHDYYDRAPRYGWNSWGYGWGLSWDSGRDGRRDYRHGHGRDYGRDYGRGHRDRSDRRHRHDRDRGWDRDHRHDRDRGRDHDRRRHH